MSAPTKPKIISVIEAGRYRGYLLPRFNGYTAFDAADINIGMFETAEAAHAAILAEARS